MPYPPVGFYFKVEINGFPGDIGFQKVEGLKAEVPNEEKYEEGGENTYTHRFPQRMSYGDLTLSRGVLVGSDLIQWFEISIQLFIFAPRDVTVTLMDETGGALDQWIFRNAWPKAWEIGDLDASTSSVLAEKIVLSYQYFYRGKKLLDI